MAKMNLEHELAWEETIELLAYEERTDGVFDCRS